MDRSSKKQEEEIKTENNLEELKQGFVTESFKQGIKEPHYRAMKSFSSENAFIDHRIRMADELIRILREMQLTLNLLSEKPSDDFFLKQKVELEDLVVYYQGIFLELVHQAKDKVVQIVSSMLVDSKEIKTNKEYKRYLQDQKVSTILKNSKDKLQEIGIWKELISWDDEHVENQSGIRVALRKRTQHHHKISPIHFNELVIGVKMTRYVLQEDKLKATLSEYGKEAVGERLRTDLETLYIEAVGKSQKTLQEILENINFISLQLIKFFKLETDPFTRAQIAAEYSAQEKAFKIKRTSSYVNLLSNKVDVMPFIATGLKEIKSILDKNIISIYLVGSTTRAEFVENRSDINFYVVTKDEVKQPDFKLEPLAYDIKIASKEEFNSQNYKKHRFICWSDGILLEGEDLIKNEVFPDAGGALTYLMNSDLPENFRVLEKWTIENPNASEQEVALISKPLCKDILNFIYGIIVANNPSFVFNRDERFKKIIHKHPKNEFGFKLIWRGSIYGLRKVNEINVLINSFRTTVEENIQNLALVIEKHNQMKNKS